MSDLRARAGRGRIITTTTRRRALQTGGIAALVAGFLGTAPAPVAAHPVASTLPLIDHAEAMLVELQGIMLRLDSRNQFNLSVNLENMARLGEVSEGRIPEVLAEYPLMIGPGNRMWDVMDATDEAERRAAVTHAPLVAQYADRYHAGGTAAGTAIRAELAAAHGDNLGSAIAGAAFNLYLHQRHCDVGDMLTCVRCNDDA